MDIIKTIKEVRKKNLHYIAAYLLFGVALSIQLRDVPAIQFDPWGSLFLWPLLLIKNIDVLSAMSTEIIISAIVAVIGWYYIKKKFVDK